MTLSLTGGPTQVRASLAPYLYQRRTGRPWTVLKVALGLGLGLGLGRGRGLGLGLTLSPTLTLSLTLSSTLPLPLPLTRSLPAREVASTADGAIACADGSSQWITGPRARAHGQLLRAASQAIMVGSGTALADEPRLTRRLDEGATPAAEPST